MNVLPCLIRCPGDENRLLERGALSVVAELRLQQL
jgi:hypothetical protein